MSLINDALKRASKSIRNREPEPEAPPEVFIEPVVERPRRSLIPLFITGIVVALGLMGWIFWQWWDANHWSVPATIYPVVTVVSNAEPATAAPASTSPPSVDIATPTPDTAPPPAKPAEPAWPADLKLMGIFFSQTNPRAIINGRTVGVGDDLDGIRITKIENDRVTVEWNGKVKELMVE